LLGALTRRLQKLLAGFEILITGKIINNTDGTHASRYNLQQQYPLYHNNIQNIKDNRDSRV